MDTLNELAADLSSILDRLHREASDRDLRHLMAPLSWLDEANAWLRFELDQVGQPPVREAVPFTYIPVELRK